MMSAGLTTRPCALAVPATPKSNARTESVSLQRCLFIVAKSLSATCHSKCWRRVDPQDPGLLAPRILPAVRNRAFKIKTVARSQPIMLTLIQPDLKVPAKHVQEFLAFMRIGLAAAAAGLHAKKMRLHRRVAPGKQLHANVRRRFQNFSFGRPHQTLVFAGSFE